MPSIPTVQNVSLELWRFGQHSSHATIPPVMEKASHSRDERIARLTDQLLAEIGQYINLASLPSDIRATFAFGMSTLISSYLVGELDLTDEEILEKAGALMFTAFCADADRRRNVQVNQPLPSPEPPHNLPS